MFRALDDKIMVSPQIPLEAIDAARDRGVTLIVNNRPDGEDPAAPQGDEIEAAARAAGLDYVAIPVTHSGFSANQVLAMRAALDNAAGKVLAYCRSGTRSTLLWSLAEAQAGRPLDDISRLAANAGYDTSPVRALMETLAPRD